MSRRAKRGGGLLKARARARATAYNRPWVNGCCQKCGRPLVLRPSEARSEFEIANAHEIEFRSLGGDPTDSKNILILCVFCHLRGVHRQGARSEWLSIEVVNAETLADDPNGVRIVEWRGKSVVMADDVAA